VIVRSGKAGKATIRELLNHGYQVMNVDTVAHAEHLCHLMKIDLNDLGQADRLAEISCRLHRPPADGGRPAIATDVIDQIPKGARPADILRR
jgi:hypothetical protein